MLRSIQIKIVMIFMILGILIIGSLGLFFVYNLNVIDKTIMIDTMTVQDVKVLVENQMNYTKNIIFISLALFTIIILALGIFVAKVIIEPISRLIKSAELIARGEEIDQRFLIKAKKHKRSEIDDLVNAFSLMHKELKENLNEVTRQKNQIETILLHMTDGVIAFNIDGAIIHINPAAKTFLNIERNMKFEDIFEKFNVDINMEKIIYLENWTSSERKLTIDDYDGWEISDNEDFPKDVIHFFHYSDSFIPRGVEDGASQTIRLYIKLTWSRQMENVLIIISFHD